MEALATDQPTLATGERNNKGEGSNAAATFNCQARLRRALPGMIDFHGNIGLRPDYDGRVSCLGLNLHRNARGWRVSMNFNSKRRVTAYGRTRFGSVRGEC